jgi:hypothetical protein
MDKIYKFVEKEFNGEDDSFLIKLRIALFWDKKKFFILLTAMKVICEDQEKNDKLNRKLAEGFWYLSNFIESWTSHKNFPKNYPSKYYELAYELIFLLSDWFFTGKSPFLDEKSFDEKLNELNQIQ